VSARVGHDPEAARAARELISHWMALFRAIRFYEAGNDAIAALADRVLADVRALLGGAVDLELAVRQDSIFVGGERVRESALASAGYHGLIDTLRAARVRGLRIDEDATAREVEVVARLILEAAAATRSPGELRGELLVRGAAHVDVSFDEGGEPVSERRSGEEVAKRIYLRSIGVVREVFHTLRTHDRINARKVKRIVQQMIESLGADPGYLLHLSSLKNYDEYTFNHSVNVSVLAIALGRQIGLSRRQLYLVGQAGMLHDLGKLCIPKEILNKPGRLTPEERKLVEQHPVEGFVSIATRLGVMSDTIPVALTAFQHHANLDGSGYPPAAVRGTRALLSRLVAIVDRYDAMTSARVYRGGPIPPQKALSIMFHSQRSHHDQTLLRYFMNMMGLFPLGSAVKLSDGSIAVVVGGAEEPRMRHMPRVKIVLDPDGGPASHDVIDLSAEAKDEDALRIEECIDPAKYGIEVMDYIL
jgi:HD-GYP domain-containing protein (c-di-GMP phosphodiesterase class II)